MFLAPICEPFRNTKPATGKRLVLSPRAEEETLKEGEVRAVCHYLVICNYSPLLLSPLPPAGLSRLQVSCDRGTARLRPPQVSGTQGIPPGGPGPCGAPRAPSQQL